MTAGRFFLNTSNGSRGCFVRGRHVQMSIPRIRLFSTDGNNRNLTKADHRLLFEEEMEDMKAEREALFGFTAEDHVAWSNAGGHKHDASFMEMIDEARRIEDSKANGSKAIEAKSSSQIPPTDIEAITNRALSHLTKDGKEVHMVDVGAKEVTKRVAVAESKVVFPPEVLENFSTQSDELVGPKGPIFATARIAGIMAAK